MIKWLKEKYPETYRNGGFVGTQVTNRFDGTPTGLKQSAVYYEMTTSSFVGTKTNSQIELSIVLKEEDAPV